MKQRIQGLIAGLLIGTMLSGGTVFAKQTEEIISVIYDNIKIMIDGVEYTAKDANGNVVEPFIYNGTTYLPVRGIANAFGKDVSWEPQTSTVALGSKNYDWLDQMGYANYETTGVNNTISSISKDTKADDGMIFNRGIYYHLCIGTNGARKNDNQPAESYQFTEYLLNNNYKTFSGTIIAMGSNWNGKLPVNALVKIYGDGNLLYTSPIISEGTKSTKFDIDVSNYKTLKILAELPNFEMYGDYSKLYYRDVGLADVRLAKK